MPPLNKRQKQKKKQPCASAPAKTKTITTPPGGGYIDDGRGWTARPKSEYMKTPEYNKDLWRQMWKEKKEQKEKGNSI